MNDKIFLKCKYCGFEWSQETYSYLFEPYYIIRCIKCDDKNIEKSVYNKDVFGYNITRGKHDYTTRKI